MRQGDLTLKIDFVADRAPRIGVPENRDGRYVDTVRNILSNKVGAILARDEARDVADLVEIRRSYRFAWVPVLPEALIHTMVQDIESERDSTIADDRAPAL